MLDYPVQVLQHDPAVWMNLQTNYDLRVAEGNTPLNKIKPRVAA
jgi:plasmid maintenance system antidote protein VapI